MAFWEKLKKVLVGDPVEMPEKLSSSRSNSDDDEDSGSVWGAAKAAAAPEPDAADIGDYKKVVVERGGRGWGGPLTVQPTKKRRLVYSVTGGGIHPVAQRIADMTGAEPFDGFRSKAEFDELACVVIDCGGTARVGVYPMKGILTIDVYPTSPSGPLAKYINDKNFVSGVTVDCIKQA